MERIEIFVIAFCSISMLLAVGLIVMFSVVSAFQTDWMWWGIAIALAAAIVVCNAAFLINFYALAAPLPLPSAPTSPAPAQEIKQA
jgi:hypothetical protein